MAVLHDTDLFDRIRPGSPLSNAESGLDVPAPRSTSRPEHHPDRGP